MTGAKPVWLLGVDGVLNAPHPEWGDQPQSGIAAMRLERFRFRWSPALLREVRSIRDSGLVEIRWCSSWCADISSPAALFGMDGVALAFEGENVGRRADKFFAVETVLRVERRPLVWTDDDIDWVVSGATAGGGLPEGGASRLLVQTSGSVGLTPADVDAIWEFLKAYEAGQPG